MSGEDATLEQKQVSAVQPTEWETALCTLIIETESSCIFAYINTTEVSLFDTGVGQ